MSSIRQHAAVMEQISEADAGGSIIDIEKAKEDESYRNAMRHRCETDHFFLALAMGLNAFVEDIHRDVANLYFPKNRNIPIHQQHHIKRRMHLDPRETGKSTFGRVDSVQWLIAFPERMMMVNATATQPLARTISAAIAKVFWHPAGTAAKPMHVLYPELVTRSEPFRNTEYWDTPGHVRQDIDIDHTIAFTSPQSTQSGWHPWVFNPDDMVDEKNSGIRRTEETRQGIITTYQTNKNTVLRGGYVNMRGTRYHPFELYGRLLETMDQDNPEDTNWKTLIRSAVVLKNGERLDPGRFPKEQDMLLPFAAMGLDYRHVKTLFDEDYESFMCFTEGHRVLMADWTEKPIEQMAVGDEVIGFEKRGPRDSRLVVTKVVRTFRRRTEVVLSRSECGRTLKHTPDHKFLMPGNGGDLRYEPLKAGRKLVSVYTPSAAPTPDQQRDLDWLAGILDGEGTISRAGACIYQKEATNPEIFAALKGVLNNVNIKYGMSKTHATEVFSLRGGRSLLIRLLQYTRIMKRSRIVKALWGAKQLSESTGRGGGRLLSKVLDITPIGNHLVYDIETETHNFVCEGFAVHNCQQQNDPLGGATPTFSDRLYGSCSIDPERIPTHRDGETYICWRLPWGTKKDTSYLEGAAVRVVDGKVYVIDCWQGTYIPSRLAEKIVDEQKKHQADGIFLFDTPGSGNMWENIKNAALMKNVNIPLQWMWWTESETERMDRIKQLEPMLKSGRIFIATGMTKGLHCRKQFVNFGLIPETGIIECIARLADQVPLSLMRAQIEDEEIEAQRKTREFGLISSLLRQQGMPKVDDIAVQRAKAHAAAMARATNSRGLPGLPGGLDG